MITVSGSAFDISSIYGTYRESSVERQLLDKMSGSAGRYQYDSLEQLKFELSLRREIVNAARALSNSSFSFAGFTDSRCNTEYWNRTNNGGFSLRQGTDPASAIGDIFTNGRSYATECATAMPIVYYKALLEVYGREVFNRQFKSIYLMDWDIREPLLRSVGTPKKAADVLLGDRGYFKNPDVDPTTPEWQGENVIVLPDSLYYGHGIGIAGADRIIRALNANRKRGAERSAYFIDAVARPDFKRLFDVLRPARPVTLVWKPFPKPI